MNLQQLEAKLSLHPESPLFIRVVQEYLMAGQIEKAKEICLSGLERYPSYVTGLLVLAKCYAAEKQFDGAIHLLKQVIALYPNSEVLQALLTEWQQPIVQPPVQTESEPQPLKELTNEQNTIVSRTLAEIYALQAQHREAIRIYKLLKEQEPARKEEFDRRIQELENDASNLK